MKNILFLGICFLLVFGAFAQNNDPCYTTHASNFTVNSGYVTDGDVDTGMTPNNSRRLASNGSGANISHTTSGITPGSITLRFRAKGWNASETSVTVSVEGITQTVTNLPTTFGWVELTFNVTTTNPTINFTTTSGKRLHLGIVQIICNQVNNTIHILSAPAIAFVTCETPITHQLSFDTTGTFQINNLFTVQLSSSQTDFSQAQTISTAQAGTNGTLSYSIPAGTPTGTYYIRIVATNPSLASANYLEILVELTNAPCPVPHINLTYHTNTAYFVDCNAGANGAVEFNTYGTFTAANTFTVQLSNSTGNFSTPTNIGSITLGGNAPQGTIAITIPAMTGTGSNYQVRIISSEQGLISNSSNAFSITLTNGPCVLIPPHLTTAYINSCESTGCSEGANEMVFGSTGHYSVLVNTSNFNFFYGTSSTGTNYSNTLVNNAATINLLNQAANCGTLFVDALGQTLPPNASWIFAHTDICVSALQWEGLCGSGPIYVIFNNDTDWQMNGNFANSPNAGAMRYFRTNITTTTGQSFNISNNVTGGQYDNSDGVYASFSYTGGPATSYGDDDCNLSPILLSTDLLHYTGHKAQHDAVLQWTTYSETNSSHFTIKRSLDGIEWLTIGTSTAAGNSQNPLHYEIIDERPANGTNYYRLEATDLNGNTQNKGIVALDFNVLSMHYNSTTHTIELSEAADVVIYSVDGKVVQRSEHQLTIPFVGSGMYLVQINDKQVERIYVH